MGANGVLWLTAAKVVIYWAWQITGKIGIIVASRNRRIRSRFFSGNRASFTSSFSGHFCSLLCSIPVKGIVESVLSDSEVLLMDWMAKASRFNFELLIQKFRIMLKCECLIVGLTGTSEYTCTIWCLTIYKERANKKVLWGALSQETGTRTVDITLRVKYNAAAARAAASDH